MQMTKRRRNAGTSCYFTSHGEGRAKQTPAVLVIMELQLKHYKSDPAKLKTNVLSLIYLVVFYQI